MLWVHVSSDFNAIVSKRRNPAQNFGNFKEGMKFGPHPPAIFAQVFILRLLARARRMSLLSKRSASPCSFVAPAIAVPSDAALSSMSVATVSARLAEGRENECALIRTHGDNPPRRISSMFYFTLRVKTRFRGDPRLPPSAPRFPTR